MKYSLILAGVLSFTGFVAQTTIGHDTSQPGKLTTAGSAKAGKHKILIVPFNNKMYMSEIDHVINSETKQDQKQIRWEFRDKMDEQLYKKLKSKYEVVSLLEDTSKNRKEIAMVASGVGYKFDKIPDQNNYRAPKSDYKQEGQIKKGQISDEVNNDERFMNCKIQDKGLLSALNTKYKANVFVFINELDLKAPPINATDFNADKNRTAIIHYTVFSLDGKEINSGTVSVKFPKNANDPAKITNSYLSKGLEEIANRVDKALHPPAIVTGK